MPYLRLEISPDVRVENERVLRACARTIVETLEVKAGSLRLRVETLSPGSFLITDAADAGQAANGKLSGSWVVAHVAILEGRSDEKKIRLIAELTRVLTQELGVDESDVRVFVVEYPKVQWGIGGKTAAAAGR
jgi:4-oxalocrotonate tautomerase